MNNKIKIILILVCVAMAFTGIGIWGYLKANDTLQPEIDNEVVVDGETHKEFKAELTGFAPLTTKEYKISLKGDAANSYNVKLRFCDSDNGALQQYLTVTITAGEFEMAGVPLASLFGMQEINLGTNASEIVIAYTMIDTDDNASQGTACDFRIEIIASNG